MNHRTLNHFSSSTAKKSEINISWLQIFSNNLQILARAFENGEFCGQFHQHVKSSFMGLDHKSAKKCSQAVSLFFALLGSGPVKASSKTLVKLTPDNVLNMNLDRSKEMRKSF